MRKDIDRNKISGGQRRRAEHLRDRLERKGLGRDHAAKEGMARAMDEMGDSAGGKHSGSEPGKHANHERIRRLGSAKKAHSGQP
jgi:hypothetical protein